MHYVLLQLIQYINSFFIFSYIHVQILNIHAVDAATAAAAALSLRPLLMVSILRTN